MMQPHTTIQWIIQRNLTSRDDLNNLEKVCKELNILFITVDVIPFTTVLPPFNILPGNIYYGSTTFSSLLYENPLTRTGLFFDPSAFSIENYLDKWGSYMLNNGATITTFNNLIEADYEPEKLLFIRPDNDDKSFAGEVKRFSAIRTWFDSFTRVANVELSGQTKIIISEPYHLQYEWRLWIVARKVIAASLYRKDFRLTKERGCPQAVISFAEDRCREYTPHAVFVMDVCLCGDDYFIVECNGMNSAGFYHADVEKIVSSVSGYFIKEINA